MFIRPDKEELENHDPEFTVLAEMFNDNFSQFFKKNRRPLKFLKPVLCNHNYYCFFPQGPVCLFMMCRALLFADDRDSLSESCLNYPMIVLRYHQFIQVLLLSGQVPYL